MSARTIDRCRDVERRSMEILRPFIEQRAWNGQYILVEKGRLAKELQQTYGDILMNSARNGGVCAVEVKAEACNRYQNLFIETWSNRSRWNKGWVYKLNADVLMYHFIEEDELYTMSFEELRRWLFVHSSGQRPRLYNYYPKVQSKHQQMNDTWGVCIPIAHLRGGLKTFKQFVASTGECASSSEADLFGGNAA